MILHLDGDAFFTSVEQAVNPALKGKPVVTGKERSIIACVSYEARALGIQRGIPLFEALRKVRDLTVLPSDYETYGIFSKRMFDIMRRYTPAVEEYSIDEGFADLAGLRRLFKTSYEGIARRIQERIFEELGITVSCGLSLTKSLAKLGSKFRKPHGFTAIQDRHIHLFLQRVTLEQVWGFGPNTVLLLRKKGIHTPYDFIMRPERWAERLMGKVGRELWNELRGNSVYPVVTEEKSSCYTISRRRTFSPPSRDRAFVYAQLVRNMESAFAKLRRNRLRAGMMGISLRRQDFDEDSVEAVFNRTTSSIHEAVPLVHALFDRSFRGNTEYRATWLVLGKLESNEQEQYELFEDRLKIEKCAKASFAMDAVNRRFGRHKLCLGSSLFPAEQKMEDGKSARKRLKIPRLYIKV